MDFLENQVEFTDCLLLAVYNASVAVGNEFTYSQIKKYAVRKKWYKFGVGISTEHLPALGKRFRVSFKLIDAKEPLHMICKKALRGIPVMVLIPPIDLPAGHGMIAVKGNKGVRLLGPYFGPGTGWRLFCRSFTRPYFGERLSAYEVRRAA